MREKVFKTAWQIFKLNFVDTFSKAVKISWKIVKMSYGITTTIEYAKETGELRTANAIQISSLDYISKGYVKYVEEINGRFNWRSFRIDRVIC